MATNAQATQKFVPLREVRDGVVILKDGGLRSILMVSSINFALKSQDEQAAILAQFQSFMNTLDFSIQIAIQSRRLDINPYLELLRSREADQANDLMKIQLREYIEFIRTFTTEVDIMSKTFFVIVPYSPISVDVKKGVGALISTLKQEKQEIDLSRFEEHRSQLEQRISIVVQGLSRIGLRTVPLGADEITELFYHIFNPGDQEFSAPTR